MSFLSVLWISWFLRSVLALNISICFQMKAGYNKGLGKTRKEKKFSKHSLRSVEGGKAVTYVVLVVIGRAFLALSEALGGPSLWSVETQLIFHPLGYSEHKSTRPGECFGKLSDMRKTASVILNFLTQIEKCRALNPDVLPLGLNNEILGNSCLWDLSVSSNF